MAKRKTPEEIVAEYELALKRQQSQLAKVIDQLYNDLINAVTPYAAANVLPRGKFAISKLPNLEARIDALIKVLNAKIESAVVSGINGAWELSNVKNNLIADIRIDKALLPQNKIVQFYDTNAGALKAFKQRQANGIKLSDRIYRAGEQLKAELEAGIGLGISKGQSAAEMGRDLRQYLKEPERLFRRVRDAKGNLQLSKNAKAFKPGQGVYRSSRANIERLTRTETNLAYRKSDSERYKQQNFVLGFEWKLSASHQKCDVCDSLAGEYPTDFVFTGAHPHCLCYTVPILMTKDQFIAYRKLIIAGTDTEANIAKIATPVSSIPKSASDWFENNKEKLQGLKSMPYFIDQNPDYFTFENAA